MDLTRINTIIAQVAFMKLMPELNVWIVNFPDNTTLLKFILVFLIVVIVSYAAKMLYRKKMGKD
jgi:hypothetical protein